MKQLPDERIIFFGDTARTPYGSKSPDTIRQFTMQIGDFLVKNDVKMIVIACNTVSATSPGGSAQRLSPDSRHRRHLTDGKGGGGLLQRGKTGSASSPPK